MPPRTKLLLQVWTSSLAHSREWRPDLLVTGGDCVTVNISLCLVYMNVCVCHVCVCDVCVCMCVCVCVCVCVPHRCGRGCCPRLARRGSTASLCVGVCVRVCVCVCVCVCFDI